MPRIQIFHEKWRKWLGSYASYLRPWVAKKPLVSTLWRNKSRRALAFLNLAWVEVWVWAWVEVWVWVWAVVWVWVWAHQAA